MFLIDFAVRRFSHRFERITARIARLLPSQSVAPSVVALVLGGGAVLLDTALRALLP